MFTPFAHVEMSNVNVEDPEAIHNEPGHVIRLFIDNETLELFLSSYDPGIPDSLSYEDSKVLAHAILDAVLATKK